MSLKTVTLAVSVNGSVKNITVQSDCRIRRLMDECIAHGIFPELIGIVDFNLIYNGKPLKYEANQTLLTYAVEDKATLSVCLLVKSGATCLQELPGEVTPTKEPCAISLDDDQEEWRAKMKCGHVLSVDSMINYIKSALNDGQAVFGCLICKGSNKITEWKYNVIRHVISYGLSEEELYKIDDQLNENGLKNEAEIKRCPQCDSMCQRSDWEITRAGSSNRVTCIMCLKSCEAKLSAPGGNFIEGSVFDFCWSCGKTWVNLSLLDSCGNEGCDGLTRLERRNIDLRECGTKKIGSVEGCPKLRACIVCNSLVYHNDACKHVKCPRCGIQFCFVCLLPRKPPFIRDRNNMELGWECGPAYGPCHTGIAPRQQLEHDRQYTPVISISSARNVRQGNRRANAVIRLAEIPPFNPQANEARARAANAAVLRVNGNHNPCAQRRPGAGLIPVLPRQPPGEEDYVLAPVRNGRVQGGIADRINALNIARQNQHN